MRIFCGLLVLGALSSCFGQEFGDVSGKVSDASTNLPLANARIILVRVGEHNSKTMKEIWEVEPLAVAPDPAGDIFVAFTDAYGSFRFRTTIPARFLLYASHGGYVSLGDGIDSSKIIEVTSTSGGGGINVSLDPIGSISGKIIDTDTSKPIQGLQVVPMKWYAGEGSRALIFAGESARTDTNGNYKLTDLKPGEYVLRVVPVSQARFLLASEVTRLREQHGYARTYYPGVETPEQSSTITLLPGGSVRGIDLALTQGNIASLRGRVIVNEPGTGEITVSLTEVEKQGNVSSYRSVAKGKLLPEITTFQFDGLSPGTYVVVATTNGKAVELSRAFASIQVEQQNVDSVELILRRGIIISGRIKLSESSLNGSFPQEKPLRVFLTPRNRQAFEGERPPGEVVFPKATFALTNVYEGSYDVTLKGLPETLVICDMSYNGGKAAWRVLTPSMGALDHNIEITVCPATASISLTARDGLKPSSDVQFILVPDPSDPSAPYKDVKTVRADSEGRGTFSNLLAGKYRVTAVPNNANWRTTSSFGASVSEEITVKPGMFQSYDLKLAKN